MYQDKLVIFLSGDRNSIIVRTSVIGIAVNILLVIFKTVVGLLANSIAVVLDALNNLSDVVSSVVTILGTKLAGRKPDREHPYGHGRYEYLSAMAVSALILYAGITALVESIKKIISPEIPDYSVVSLVIIGSAVVVKFFLGRYVKSVGEKINSHSLTSSGADALFDAVISLSVFISALIYIFTGVCLEAYVGVLISAFIIKSGIGMLKQTIDDILGKRIDSETSKAVKQTICSADGVYGAYDLFIDNYGPDFYIASVHIEVDDTMTADQIDRLTRKISEEVYQKHKIIMTGISIYSRNTTNDKIAEMRSDITRMAVSSDKIIQIHGFYADEAEKTIRFDVVVDYGFEEKFFESLCKEVREKYPDYKVFISKDYDISE